MNKRLRRLGLLFVVAMIAVAQVGAQAPVTLNKSEYYINVLQDGRLQITYELTFTEHEGERDRIRELPPLESPSTVLEAFGTGPDGRFNVTLQPTGVANVYSAVFDQSTHIGDQYTVTIAYEVDRSVFDATTIDGEAYRAIGWASGGWELPIEVLAATFVLPIEVPEDVTSPEQVTDQLVNQAGVKVGDLSDFHRWVYFPTPDSSTGKNWLSIYIEKREVPASGQMQPPFFLRASDIPVTRDTPIPIRPTPATPGTTAAQSTTALALLFCVALGAMSAVALVVVRVTRRSRPAVRPKAEPVTPTAPRRRARHERVVPQTPPPSVTTPAAQAPAASPLSAPVVQAQPQLEVPQSDSAITVGEMICNAKYQVERLLGEGGQSRVWLARELLRGLEVAIKEPLPALSDEDRAELRGRFEREMRLSGQLLELEVPNVVRAYTVEEHKGQRLLVMEYCPGGSLAVRIKTGPLHQAEAVRVTLQVCTALSVLHQQLSIIHRDIKPSNILFTSDGRAKLSDFGLAQTDESMRSRGTADRHPGTPGYMSPEQETSIGYLNPSSDLYSLGCVLFEMLTGQRYQRQRPGMPACSLRPGLPAWLDAVLAKALHQDSWQRYQTAEEMAKALRIGSGRT